MTVMSGAMRFVSSICRVWVNAEVLEAQVAWLGPERRSKRACELPGQVFRGRVSANPA